MPAKSKRIQDLYFGVILPNWLTSIRKGQSYANLFDIGRIRYYAAQYLVASTRDGMRNLADSDPLFFIFGDVWCRAQYEFIVSSFPKDAEETKLSIFDIFVAPNRKLLLGMINECSEASAKTYIKEWKKAHPTR